MITFFSVVRILILAVIVPVLLGNLICISGTNKRLNMAESVAYGFMVMCVSFLLLAVPMIFLRLTFHVLLYSWIALTFLLCFISVFVSVRKNRYGELRREAVDFCAGISSDRFTFIIWIAAALVIIFEACLPAFRMHIDTDDARFIAEAMEAVEKDTMLLHHAITGKYIGFVPGEQIKDVTSPYPLFIALLSKLYGLHPAITAHTVLPFLLIILSYIVFGMIGGFLTGGDIKKTGLFLLFLSLIDLFSFETIYASGYTLLTIIWQGRSVCAMITLPLLWYVLMCVSVKERMGLADYLLLIAMGLCNTMMSNMGSIFAPVLIMVYAIARYIKEKSFAHFILMCLCALPSLSGIVITRVLRMFL